MYSVYKLKVVKMVNIVFIRNDLMLKGWFCKSKLKIYLKLKCFYLSLFYLCGVKIV